jgi:hypothetical protein
MKVFNLCQAELDSASKTLFEIKWQKETIIIIGFT